MCAAALCLAGAAWLMAGHERGLRRARLLFADAGAVALPPWWSWARLLPLIRLRREWLCLPAALTVALVAASPLPLALGAVAVPLVRRWLRAREHRRDSDRRARGVIDLCGATAGELRAGMQPAQALLFAAAATDVLGREEAAVLAAARFGGDVPGALRTAARQPGAEGLAGMAACWRVAVDSGAGLAAGLDRLEAALRAESDQREDLAAQLAGAWSTIALLALLPAAGLAMGWALGADPLSVLFHTPAGIACLVIGGLLETAGLCWAGRIVRAGEKA
ncbi:type II secretion system F family protein [Streptomyces peucetius]|uniref:Type II secretion system F family protein n=2 Tax=Streptomyces peucetius TaxID=1950 RepID=A0ABY6IHV5_STRPE|nr:type II secretion system F family protein [Streptomyces peucetius]UYQ66597.1 type II secretion system F family protein [Streptomyces peucetius]